MTSYYSELSLMDDGRFKNKNYPLKFGLNEIKTIYENIDSSNKTLIDLTGLSEATIHRIKQAINTGLLDEYLPCDGTYHIHPNPKKSVDGVVNIRDIHITINNNPMKEEEDESVEQSIKFNQMKLKQWSKKVRKRGAYICAKCGRIDKEHSQAHHIFSKASYPVLACDEGNGIVLCQSCHADYHKKYSVDDVNPYTFIGWLNK